MDCNSAEDNWGKNLRRNKIQAHRASLWAYICFLANSFHLKEKRSKNEHSYNETTHVEEGLDSVHKKKPERIENYRASNPIVYSCASLMTSIENASLFWMDKTAKSRNVRNYRTVKRDKTELLKISNKICLTPKGGSPDYISESGTSKECANINILDQSANSSAPNEYWKGFKSHKLQKHNKIDKTIKFSKSYDNLKDDKQGQVNNKKVVKSVKCSKRISWLYWLSGKHNKFRSFSKSGRKGYSHNLGVQCKKSNLDNFRGHEVPRVVTEIYESCNSSSEDFMKAAKSQSKKSCMCSSHCPPVRCPKPVPEICPKPRKAKSPQPSKEKCPKPPKPSKSVSPKPSKEKCPKPPKPPKSVSPKPSKEKCPKPPKPAKAKSPKPSKEKCPKPRKVKSPKPSKEKCKPPKPVKPPKLPPCPKPKPPKDYCPKPPKPKSPKPSKEKYPKPPKEKPPKPKKDKKKYSSSSSSHSSTCSSKSYKNSSSSTSSSSGKKRGKPPKPPKPPKPQKDKKSSTSSSGSMSKYCPPTNKESKVRFSKSSSSTSSSCASGHIVKSKAKPICNLPKTIAPKMEYTSKKKKRAVKHRLICIGPVNDSKQKVNVQLKIEIDEPDCPPQLECGGECQPKPKCIEVSCECDSPKPSQVCKTTKTKPVKKPSKPSVSSKSCACMSLPNLSKKAQKEIQCDCSVPTPKKTSQKGCDTKAEVAIQKRSYECKCIQPDLCSPSTMKKKEKSNSNSCTCIVCQGDCKPPVCKMSNKCLSANIKKKRHIECECDLASMPSKCKISPKSSPTEIVLAKSSCGCSHYAPGTKLGSKTGGQRLDCQPSKPKSSKSQKSNKSLDPCSKPPSAKSSKAMKCTIKKIKSNKCKIQKIKSMCKIKKVKSSKRDPCEELLQTKPKKYKNITNMGIQCGMGSMCGVIAPCLMDKQCGKDADPGASVQCARSSIIHRDRLVATKTFENLKRDDTDACSSYNNRTSLDEVALHEGIDLTTLCSHDRSRDRMCYAVLDQEDGTDGKNKIREDIGSRVRSEVQDLKNAVMGDWSNKDTDKGQGIRVVKLNETEVSPPRKENHSLIRPHGFPTTYFTSKILRRKKDKSLINAMHGLHLVSWAPSNEEPHHRQIVLERQAVALQGQVVAVGWGGSQAACRSVLW
ncbi:hypothetical protein MSG28_014347 [Choristoneura fumiferana]|uniref:Uncharacterized protein n=1 Tax=Choristoneura fumiferana TaxID=7141 RepID=A0ACC0JGT9_CHOFU|nr:hypothetical protein MSG28_014347 [Choristoneura fumiferana]